jgi:hypothetical protein
MLSLMKHFWISLLVLTLASFCAAQTPAALPAGAVVTDGAVNPSAISDAIALRMFFAMTAAKNTPAASTLVGPSSAPAALPQTITIFLGQLNVKDKTIMTQHVNSWASENLALLSTATTATVNADAEARLKQLHATLSPDGWKALVAELARRKPFIKVYEYPAGMGTMSMQ